MTTYFVMLVFYTGMAGAAIEKVGVYDTRDACVAAAEEAGFSPLAKNSIKEVSHYACVKAGDPYGVAE